MSFRQDRRRRLITDDESLSASAEGSDSVSSSGSASKGTYAAAARADQQPRLVDFVPRRYLTMGLVFMVGVVALAALELIYTWVDRIAAFSPGAKTLVDLSAPGSVASWFGSLLCGTAALGALLIYSLRRHRMDDYHGRYRIWLWIFIAAALGSIDETTLWHRIAPEAFAPLAKWSGLSPLTVTLAIAGVVLGYPAIRLLFEVRHCRLALVTFIMAGAAWTSATVTLPQAIVAKAAHAVMVGYAAKALGHLLFLTTIVLFARHILLDAEGRLPARSAKKKRVKKVKAKPASDGESRIDSAERSRPHVGGRSDLEPVAAGRSSRDESEEEDDSSDDSDSQGLSRAEKKKLRREQRRLERQTR